MLQRLNTKYTKELTLSELLIVNKSDLLTECDPRLKSFLKSGTEKKKYGSKMIKSHHCQIFLRIY